MTQSENAHIRTETDEFSVMVDLAIEAKERIYVAGLIDDRKSALSLQEQLVELALMICYGPVEDDPTFYGD